MATYHEVPDELLRLGVHGLVPGADGDLLGPEHVEHLDVDGPEAPAPVLAVLGWALRVVEGAHLPRLTAVQGHLHPCNLPAATWQQDRSSPAGRLAQELNIDYSKRNDRQSLGRPNNVQLLLSFLSRRPELKLNSDSSSSPPFEDKDSIRYFWGHVGGMGDDEMPGRWPTHRSTRSP